MSGVKILRIIARLNVGGPARHVTLLNAGLEARGHRTILIHGPVDTGEASLEQLAIDRRIPLINVRHMGRRISILSDARAFTTLVRTIFRESPDVVHTHTAKAGTLGRAAALLFNATRERRRRCLVVHTYHGHVLDGYFHPIANWMIRLTERRLAAITDRVVTISPSQRRDIVERFAVASDRQTTVIPLGIDLETLLDVGAHTPDFRDRLGAGPNDIIVGYAGRMVPIKDLPTLLRGFALALGHNPGLRLMLAGGGPLRPDLEQLTAELQMASRTHLLGWTDDLPGLYATMDMCALSSLNEGTPVAAIEAMAAGKPVVATRVGGVSDVVEDGVTGLLVAAHSPEQVAEAILRLASDAALRRRMGEAGRQRAAERYPHTRLVHDVEQLYLEGLAEKRR